MSKRISELTPSNVVAPDDQLEIAMVDGSSPTGYVSRRISASLLGGTMPFRYEIADAVVLSGYPTFEISLSYEELVRSMVLVNESDFTSYALSGGQYRFNFQSILEYNGSFSDSCMTQVDVIHRSGDPSQAVVYNLKSAAPTGVLMYNLPNFSLDNTEDLTPYIYVTEVTQYDYGQPTGGIVFSFSVKPTLFEERTLQSITLRGYVDAVASILPTGV